MVGHAVSLPELGLSLAEPDLLCLSVRIRDARGTFRSSASCFCRAQHPYFRRAQRLLRQNHIAGHPEVELFVSATRQRTAVAIVIGGIRCISQPPQVRGRVPANDALQPTVSARVVAIRRWRLSSCCACFRSGRTLPDGSQNGPDLDHFERAARPLRSGGVRELPYGRTQLLDPLLELFVRGRVLCRQRGGPLVDRAAQLVIVQAGGAPGRQLDVPPLQFDRPLGLRCRDGRFGSPNEVFSSMPKSFDDDTRPPRALISNPFRRSRTNRVRIIGHLP